jgi:hypothetical protein
VGKLVPQFERRRCGTKLFQRALRPHLCVGSPIRENARLEDIRGSSSFFAQFSTPTIQAPGGATTG